MKNLTLILALMFISLTFSTNAYSQKANNSYQSGKSNTAGIMEKEKALTRTSISISTEKLDLTGTTDKEGNVSFTKVDAGTYTIKIEKTKSEWIGCTITVMPEGKKEGYTFMLDGPAEMFKEGFSFYLPQSDFLTLKGVVPTVNNISINNPGVK